MYDAKENKPKDESLKFNCIADRSYFSNICEQNIFELKSLYVPIENDLKVSE